VRCQSCGAILERRSQSRSEDFSARVSSAILFGIYKTPRSNSVVEFSRRIQEDAMFALLWELIIGLVVGAVAKFVMPGKDPGGIWITMIIGIAGSILATYLGQAIGWYQAGQGAGFIMSVVGAVVLLLIYRVIKGAAAKA
jgi:uncharacterized membrane protein YeaQ/YmgE (transglycosylase-associated protein family)